jgi:hypothetical protein
MMDPALGALTAERIEERITMARKPNYQFERQERQRAKDAKKAAKKEKAAQAIDDANAEDLDKSGDEISE